MLRSNELGAAIDMPLNGIWLALDLLDFFPIYILSRLTRRVCVQWKWVAVRTTQQTFAHYSIGVGQMNWLDFHLIDALHMYCGGPER